MWGLSGAWGKFGVILNPNPKPKTLNPKSQTLNPKTYTIKPHEAWGSAVNSSGVVCKAAVLGAGLCLLGGFRRDSMGTPVGNGG